MKRLSVSELTALLKKNGLYDDFIGRLKDNADKFPAHCTGRVEYLLAYDIHVITMPVIMDVQVIFEGPHRYSQVKDIRILTLDDYITLCFESKDFRMNYQRMVGFIQKSADAQDL